jgi:hypothetical protein
MIGCGAYRTQAEARVDHAPPELVREAVEALRREGSGAALSYAAHTRDDNHTFEYVVKAVANYHHDGERWKRWDAPVRLAFGELREGGEA